MLIINSHILLWEVRAVIATRMINICREYGSLARLRVCQPRHFWATRDVLNEFNENMIKRYYLDRASIVYVTNLVRVSIPGKWNADEPRTTDELKVIILRLRVTVKCSSDDMGVSQPMGGSFTDFKWKWSEENFRQRHGATRWHLLGDNSYPCQRWLLAPYLRPLPGL